MDGNEVKARKLKDPDLALPALAQSRDLLDTGDHYAVIDGRYRADRGVRSLEPVEGPTPPPFSTGGFLTDDDLATNLPTTQLWRESDRERRAETRFDFFWPDAVLSEPLCRGSSCPTSSSRLIKTFSAVRSGLSLTSCS